MQLRVERRFSRLEVTGVVPGLGSVCGCRHVSSVVGASSASAAAAALVFCCLCWAALGLQGGIGGVGEQGLGERAGGSLWRGLVACPSDKVRKEGKSAPSHCWAQRWWPQGCCQLVQASPPAAHGLLLANHFQCLLGHVCFFFIQPIFSTFIISTWAEFPFQTIPGNEIIYRGLRFPESSLQVQFFNSLKIALQ